jgi:SAM-dependent methyltransferase
MVPHTEIRHALRFPKESLRKHSQSESYFFINEGGNEKKLRFHDYDSIYSRPGLYEQLFYERLACDSPRQIADSLANAIAGAGEAIEPQRVLDLGAGNGISGEELKRHAISRVVAVDIIAEARDAAMRDRPGVYDDYLVADMTTLAPEQERELRDWRFTALTTVAALGFDDIPAEAFFEAVNLIEEDGWLAFTIRTDCLSEDDTSGFARLIKRLLYGDLVELHHIERYRHRLSIDGEPIFYFAVILRKRGHLDHKLLEG